MHNLVDNFLREAFSNGGVNITMVAKSPPQRLFTTELRGNILNLA